MEPRQAFCDWAKLNDEEFDFDENDDLEGSLYLIEEEFMEYEPLIEAHFKKILKMNAWLLWTMRKVSRNQAWKCSWSGSMYALVEACSIRKNNP